MMVRFTMTATILFFSFLLTNVHMETYQAANDHMDEMGKYNGTVVEKDSMLKGMNVKPAMIIEEPPSDKEKPKQPEISEEQEMIEGIIYNMPNVEPGMVIIVGDHAWVNVMFDNMLTDEERQEIVAHLEKRLHEAIPKYEYKIIVNEYMQADKKLF